MFHTNTWDHALQTNIRIKLYIICTRICALEEDMNERKLKIRKITCFHLTSDVNNSLKTMR